MADKMKVEEKFIEDAITRYRVSKFLEHELDRAGFSRVAIQRTPMVTRIAVEVTNPGRVIGKRGKSIQDLTDAIHKEFKIENPQISVVESTNQNIEPRLVAKRICKYIEKGKKIRVLEHPGLWNGAMARWNTVFVEVPIETFNPVKTIHDLLRPQHLPED